MRIFCWIALFLVIISCDQNPEAPAPLLLPDFSPVKVGSYSIYSVEDTKIEQNVSTNSIYELKIMATDSFRNEEGGYTYVMSRLKRADNTKPWTPLETWSMRLSGNGLVVNEGNIPYVKLTAPLFAGQQWNGNGLNNLGGAENCGAYLCDNYNIESMGTSYVAAGKTYDNTLTVVQNNDPDIFVKNDVRREVYAKGVGLIYKESIVLNYCTSSAAPSCYAKQFVNTGMKYKQTLKEYGVE